MTEPEKSRTMRDSATVANGVSVHTSLAKSYDNRGFYSDTSDSASESQTQVTKDGTNDVVNANRSQTDTAFDHLKQRGCQSAASSIQSWLPFVAILSNYNIRSDLLSDVMAGLIVGIMHIPQGKYTLVTLFVNYTRCK